jgi:Lon protease-like protein
MGLTLHLEDTLAEELRQEASQEHVSVEELAHRLMRDALHQRLAEKRWRSQNRRRLELVAKKMNGALPAEEQEELRQLQTLACQMVAPFDTALLQTVECLQREVEQLPMEPAP